MCLEEMEGFRGFAVETNTVRQGATIGFLLGDERFFPQLLVQLSLSCSALCFGNLDTRSGTSRWRLFGLVL